MTEYEKLKREAERKGWKVPINDVFTKDAWMSYWRNCAEYEKNQDVGRPVAPHRSA